MKLYFQHSDGSEEYICETNEKEYLSDALKDLYERNPNYKYYYVRTWTDDNKCTWMDVGSHTEFYIAKEESI